MAAFSTPLACWDLPSNLGTADTATPSTFQDTAQMAQPKPKVGGSVPHQDETRPNKTQKQFGEHLSPAVYRHVRLLTRHDAHSLNNLCRGYKLEGKSRKNFLKNLSWFQSHYIATCKSDSSNERVPLLKEYKQRPAIVLTAAEGSNPSIDIHSWLAVGQPDVNDVVLEVCARGERHRSHKKKKHDSGCMCKKCTRAKAMNQSAMEYFGAFSHATEEKLAEKEATEERPIEKKTTEEKLTEEKPIGEKASEEKANEEKQTEDEVAEKKPTEETASENNVTEKVPAKEKLTDETPHKRQRCRFARLENFTGRLRLLKVWDEQEDWVML